ncbi:hypothetical protein SAY86_003246 [Trapa natans]|uniref:Uncharacterized protein n=1 Tax=Trapa natans TaxID=22666 RepID=A0AAN7MDT0_TRANT|nr:hypothetical protein SAY86_003246 [Trapa natans]
MNTKFTENLKFVLPLPHFLLIGHSPPLHLILVPGHTVNLCESESEMEVRSEAAPVAMGLRQSKLSKSFKRALHSLLSTCSTEEIHKAFPGFSVDEKKYLHRLLIKVITSLHGQIEDEFKSLCDELQVGTSLDTVEQLIEEQSLDMLSADKSNVLDVAQDLLTAKKDEIQHLMAELTVDEERNQATRAQIKLLKEEQQDFATAISAVKKARY